MDQGPMTGGGPEERLSYLLGRVRTTAELSQLAASPRTIESRCDSAVLGLVWSVNHDC